MTTAESVTPTPSAVRSTIADIRALAARPLLSFHLIVTLTALLTVFGLVMVLSASGVESIHADGSPYTMFIQQAAFAALGFILFYLALRVPMSLVRRLSFPALVVSILMLVLVLVPSIGTEVNGGRRWFTLGSVAVQPSEITKVILAIWGAHILATRRQQNPTTRELLLPILPVTFVIAGLIVLQPNLSTAISVCIIVAALLWFAGLPLRVFGIMIAALAVSAGVLAMFAGYRAARVTSLFNPDADPQGAGYQSRQAKFALADGGWFGEGLGQGSAKWNYLPNAHNDFIFAIIGEELGFIGCLAVLGLFTIFTIVGLRIARRSADPFMRLLVGASTMWVIGQAFINIGYVIALLPVTGLQLPLISAGGSSTAMTLFLFGLIANCARHEPQAVAALQAGGDGRFGRWLRLPVPEAYAPTRLQTARDRLERERPGRPSGRRPAPRTGSMDTARPERPHPSRQQPMRRKPTRRGGPAR